MTDELIKRIAEEMIGSAGCPPLDTRLWTDEGVEELFHRWRWFSAGTVQELEAFLSPLDSKVHVEFAGKEPGERWDLSNGIESKTIVKPAIVGVYPRKMIWNLRIHWSRKPEKHTLDQVHDYIDHAIHHWKPIGVDHISYHVFWKSGALGITRRSHSNQTLRTRYSNTVRESMVRWRGDVPASTVITVHGRAKAKSSGMLVVSNRNFSRFVSNVEPFCLAWKEVSATSDSVVCQSIMGGNTLDLLLAENISPSIQDMECHVDDRPVVLHSLPRRNLFRIRLAKQKQPGDRVRVMFHSRSADRIRFGINPVVFESVERKTGENTGTFHSYIPESGEPADSETFLNPVAGLDGIERVTHPHPLDVRFADGRSVWIRPAEIEQAIARRFLNVEKVSCSSEVVWIPEPHPGFSRVVIVKVWLRRQTGVPEVFQQKAVTKLLNRHLPGWIRSRVEVAVE